MHIKQLAILYECNGNTQKRFSIMSDQIKVSVFMLAYNHDKYIEQAILSVIAQETTFTFELIIGNDSSIDQTDSVIRRLIQSNQNKKCEIVYVFHEKNIGANYNAASVFNMVRGQYMAFCEADDFWLDNKKLQLQVETLEQNQSATVCFHAVNIVDGSGRFTSEYRLEKGFQPTFRRLIQNNFIHTPSVMYRVMFKPLKLDWMMSLTGGDWISHLRHAEKGEIIYIDKVMASYRVHDGGVWSMVDESRKRLKWIQLVDAVIKNLLPQYEAGLNYSKKHCLLVLSADHFRSLQIVSGFKYLYQAVVLKTDPPMTIMTIMKRVINKFLKNIKRANA